MIPTPTPDSGGGTKTAADGPDGAPALLILSRNLLFSAPTPWDSIANGDRNSPLKTSLYMRKYLSARIARWYVDEDLHYWLLGMPLLRASMNRRANRTSARSLFGGRAEGCRKRSGVFLLPGILVATVFALAQAPNASKNNQATIKSNAVHFENIARQVGLTALNVNGNDKHNVFLIEGTGIGAVIFDYDNDGWPDIFLPNGTRVEGFPKGQEPTGHLYHNNQDGTFTDVTEKAGLAHTGWGQGGCVGDYDNDGYLDLFVTYW